MLASLRDRVAALESRIESQQARIEEVAEAPALKGAQEAATVIAVGSVQDALAAGRAFAAPLDRVAQLAPADSALGEAVTRLRPHAADGVPTRAALARRFETSAAEMHAAVGESAGWTASAPRREARPMTGRAILFLVKLGILGALVAYFVSYPGNAAIEFRGWRADMPVGLLLLAVFVLAVLLAFGDRIRRSIVRFPGWWRDSRGTRSRHCPGS
mgnify:CR=1 FL=1